MFKVAKIIAVLWFTVTEHTDSQVEKCEGDLPDSLWLNTSLLFESPKRCVCRPELVG